MHENIIISFSLTRGFLAPASGFQSTQFRLLEIMLGLKEELRVQYAQSPFTLVPILQWGIVGGSCCMVFVVWCINLSVDECEMSLSEAASLSNSRHTYAHEHTHIFA